MLKASNLTYLWPNTLQPYVTLWCMCVCDECGWAQDTVGADISTSSRGALQNMIKREPLRWTFQGARLCLPVWLTAQSVHLHQRTGPSPGSWCSVSCCWLVIFILKKCLGSFPIFFLDTQINSHPSVSPPGANRDTPEMAAIILPVCSWRDNLKIITRVSVFFILFHTTPKSNSI